MIIRISKQKTKEIIEEYYREQLDFIGKVSFKTDIQYVGYYEEEEVVVKTIIKGTMKFLGEDVKVEREVSLVEIKNAFLYRLAKENYSCESIELDTGVSQKSVGYGMNENVVEKAYFNGILLNIDEKCKKIGGKK